MFTMNQTSSSITTMQRIDREAVCPGQTDCVARLRVNVYNRALNFDLIKIWDVFINITDVNDNEPVFPSPTVVLSVPENVPVGHILHTSGAEDLDKGGTNSVQSYELAETGWSDLFRLKVTTSPDGLTDLGLELLEPLDRETRSLYQLKIVAYDKGYPMRSGSVMVNVTVADINDNRPKFDLDAYNVSVAENVRLGSPILQVRAYS
jgi:hypothetical protein